jgi:hypothetical protein
MPLRISSLRRRHWASVSSVIFLFSIMEWSYPTTFPPFAYPSCKTLTLTPSTHVLRALDKSQPLRYAFSHTRIFDDHETALMRGKYERLRAQRAGGWWKPVASILRSSLASCVGETVLGLQWRERVRSLRRELPFQSAGVLALDKAALLRARQNKVVPRKRFSASFRPCQGGGRSFWSSATSAAATAPGYAVSRQGGPYDRTEKPTVSCASGTPTAL